MPMPKDVTHPIPPIQVMIGPQPVRLQAFRTALSRDQLVEFYQKALKQKGWMVSKLPWQESIDSRMKTLDDLEKQVPDFQNYIDSSEGKKRLSPENLKTLKTKSANTLYATHDHERVMLNFYPSNAGWTGVYLSRWSGDALVPPAESAGSAQLGQAVPKASSWPETNACCSGQSVPATSRKLPLSVPDFPYARMISVGSSGQKPEVISALYTSAADQSEVMEYYRQQMTYNGWRLTRDQPDMTPALRQKAPMMFDGKEIAAGQLAFRGPEGTCLVSVTESLGGSPQAKDGTPKQRTIIIINYMELRLEQATQRTGSRHPGSDKKKAENDADPKLQ